MLLQYNLNRYIFYLIVLVILKCTLHCRVWLENKLRQLVMYLLGVFVSCKGIVYIRVILKSFQVGNWDKFNINKFRAVPEIKLHPLFKAFLI